MTSASVIINYSWSSNEQKDHNLKDTEDLGISAYALKVAKKELREDDNSREQCLSQFRDWIRKNEDIQNVRLDSQFLLRFLRVKKFSIPMAQQILLKYLNLRRTFPQIFNSLDFMSPAQRDILSNGYIFVSPVRDRQGRRVIIMNFGKFDPKKYSSAEMAKAHFIVYETLLSDPENQVLGVVHVGDVTGMTTAHVTNWNPAEFARIIKWGEQSLPLRLKEIHIVHLPASLKWVLDFVKVRMSPKMKDRFSTSVTLNDLHKQVDTAVLPQELGGTIPMKDMIESWKKELAAKRDLLLPLNNMKLLNDRGIITRHDRNNNNGQEIESLSGSFRKLEFD